MASHLDMAQWYAAALVIRVALLIYGLWQDTYMAVKFTDVDYYVFTDAAQFVSQGESPYLRSTYRYTPILAWVLTLNIWVSPLVGKLIFVVADLLVGHTIHRLVKNLSGDLRMARNCALVWLFNPLTATVSSRGNAESIIAYLVVMSLMYLVEGHIVRSSIFYGFAIHFKIYPVVYAFPIYLYLGSTSTLSKEEHTSRQRCCSLKSLLSFLKPNKSQIVFFAVTCCILGCLTAVFYLMYGWVFLYETYLYHIVRGDIRHNFSPYFYLLYLTSDPVAGVPLYLRLLVFLPQFLLVVAMATRFYQDQPLCWFLCTFVFVMANKVCTSQYFLWYLSLLPIILPNLKMTQFKAVGLLSLWFGGQAVWLLPAYLLEFWSHNTFLLIWLAGLVFYCVNGFIVHTVVYSYKPKLR